MRLLVLGGTVFLSRAVAEAAVRRGHEVVCASRGLSGSVPPGAHHVGWDRAADPPDQLAGLAPDSIVDVTRLPSHARGAVAAWPRAHWVFVSTINVYADQAGAPGVRVPAAPTLVEPRHTDAALETSPEAYGPMKLACEQIVQHGAGSAMVVRPGLIVGPGDPTGRFGYWPARLIRAAPGEEVLAPGEPGDLVQVIDVRDLAAWILDAAERRQEGVHDGVGPVTPIGELLTDTASGVGATPRWTWVDQDFLTAHGVQPWMGARSLPLWLPRPEYDAMMRHDAAGAAAAGLVTRPLAETARDTAAWLRATPGAVRTGLTSEEEAALLREWHARDR